MEQQEQQDRFLSVNKERELVKGIKDAFQRVSRTDDGLLVLQAILKACDRFAIHERSEVGALRVARYISNQLNNL